MSGSAGRRAGAKSAFWAAVCNVVGTLILLAVIATALPLTLPRLMGYEVYNVVSGSMAPSIPVGSAIWVEPAEPEAVAESEIIAFQSGESVVVHRVMENRFVVGEFVTKGDANAREDIGTVPYAALIGRVRYHIPAAGRLLALYASDVGKVYVLILAACGVMFNILAGRLRERRRELLRRDLSDAMHGGESDL